MIVRMKRLTLLCVASAGERTLEDLRELGCVHLDLSSAASAERVRAKTDLSGAETAVRILAAAAAGKVPSPAAGEAALSDADLSAPVPELLNEKPADLSAAVLAAAAVRQRLIDGAEKLRRTICTYAPFGDFDPALAMKLRDQGLFVELIRVPAGTRVSVEGGYVQSLSSEGPTIAYAAVSDRSNAAISAGSATIERVPLPTEKLSVVEKRLAAVEAKIAAYTAAFAAANSRAVSITDLYPALKDNIAFAAAEESLATQGAVSYVEGWIPSDAVPALRAKAVTESWGLLVRDPKADETPPTLIRPPKLFRPVTALFAGLGIAPAYTETDVSVPFMCYFSLFFAMLVGDGAYGAIILALALWGWKKTKPEKGGGHRPAQMRSALTLLTVFSSATVVWGVLSNTWFGVSIPCLTSGISTWLADPTYNNMMLLCFTIGVSHLMLARIWNGVCMLNDRVCLSQFGWAGILFFMYWVTNSIVGIFKGPIPTPLYVVFGVSLALVFLFTLKGSELKTRGIELGMLPLNIMSTLGDIISYVRLFAVGLASVKVAQNFNDMALGLDLPIWAKIVPMVAILLIGHGLNFAMAGLSILVHAVRLNTLEFSNHKGITWSGYAFSPFKKH